MTTRPFKTDYAGAFSGHCKTRESATESATRHILRDGYKRATITDVRTGEDVVRIVLSDDRKSVTITAIKIFRKVGY